MISKFKRIFAVEWFHSLESSGNAGVSPAAPSNPIDYIERPGTHSAEAQDNSANHSVNETPVGQVAATPSQKPAALVIGTGAKQYMLAARLSSVATTYRPKSTKYQAGNAKTKTAKKKIVRRHVRLTRPVEDNLLALKALAAANAKLQDNTATAFPHYCEKMAA